MWGSSIPTPRYIVCAGKLIYDVLLRVDGLQALGGRLCNHSSENRQREVNMTLASQRPFPRAFT